MKWNNLVRFTHCAFVLELRFVCTIHRKPGQQIKHSDWESYEKSFSKNGIIMHLFKVTCKETAH